MAGDKPEATAASSSSHSMLRLSSSNASPLRRAAFWTLLLFLLAILAALAITLGSVPASAKLIAGVLVVPIVALTLLFLYFERRGRRWAFLGAAVLGVLGIALRLIVSTQPSLEVGGGLPVGISIAYVLLGLAVVGTSLVSFLQS